jgi:hypothetical protein
LGFGVIGGHASMPGTAYFAQRFEKNMKVHELRPQDSRYHQEIKAIEKQSYLPRRKLVIVVTIA